MTCLADQPTVLTSCVCTRTSTIRKIWKTNYSEPLQLMLLENSSVHWEHHMQPACGPFIGYRIGYDALTSKMNDYGEKTFNTLISEPSALTVLSLVVVGLVIAYFYRGNTMDASKMTDDHEQLRLRTEVEGLRSRNNAIQQQLNLRRRQQEQLLKKE